jgi:hypothetical protein
LVGRTPAAIRAEVSALKVLLPASPYNGEGGAERRMGRGD